MGTYKRTDLEEDAEYDGFSFVDEDNCEFSIDTSDIESGGSTCWIKTDDEEQFLIYAYDIPKFIKMLQEADKYYKGFK